MGLDRSKFLTKVRKFTLKGGSQFWSESRGRVIIDGKLFWSLEQRYICMIGVAKNAGLVLYFEWVQKEAGFKVVVILIFV